MAHDLIAGAAQAHRTAFETFVVENTDLIAETGTMLGEALKAGNKILICGNGGSAADAQHMAGEIVGRFLVERRPYPAIALTTDTSILTAVGNDYGFDEVFARQTRGLGAPGDVLVAISTSGNSPNVLRAITAAREVGMKVVGLAGRQGGAMKDLCDRCVLSTSPDTPRIQEMHGFTVHTWCALIDEIVGAGD